MLSDAVRTYRTFLHLQPFPLFDLEQLSRDIYTAPQYLKWSLLAATAGLLRNPYLPDNQENAKIFGRSARVKAMKLASDGLASVEVVQALCLVAIRDIQGSSFNVGSWHGD